MAYEANYYNYNHHLDDSEDVLYDNHSSVASQQNLSRLSVCTSSMYTNEDDDDYVVEEDGEPLRMFMSGLSIETTSFDADVDLSDFDHKEPITINHHNHDCNKLMEYLSSDSDKDPCCYSLPATPPRRRHGCGEGLKEYASEDEARKGQKLRRSARKRRVGNVREKNDDVGSYGGCNSFSGESDHGGGGGYGGVVVITRPKGGRRSLCMDLEEVKACKELGFELEHECMMEVPASRVSVSGSNYVDTSSGGNSPTTNFRIPSPGDDPRDVKARLKRWAQAVAFASVSQHHC